MRLVVENLLYMMEYTSSSQCASSLLCNSPQQPKALIRQSEMLENSSQFMLYPATQGQTKSPICILFCQKNKTANIVFLETIISTHELIRKNFPNVTLNLLCGPLRLCLKFKILNILKNSKVLLIFFCRENGFYRNKAVIATRVYEMCVYQR